MKDIDKPLLLRALRRLGELAEENGVVLDVCLYGGALMMLAYDARKMTKDVDAIIRPAKEGFAWAVQVGGELGLPEQWLNDQVKMFVAPSEQVREIPWEAPGITLTAPTAGYLLAMKVLACRGPLPPHSTGASPSPLYAWPPPCVSATPAGEFGEAAHYPECCTECIIRAKGPCAIRRKRVRCQYACTGRARLPHPSRQHI